MQLVRCSYLPAPREVQCRVGDDPVQPGSKCLVQVESVERLVGPHKSFLHSVFSIFVYGNDRSCDCIRALGVKPDEHTERRLITLLGGGGQSPLIRSITRLIGHALRGGNGSWGHRGVI